MENIIVGITGASGVVYAQRLLQVLCRKEYNIHLSISDAAFLVIKHELGIDLNREQPNIGKFLGYTTDNVIYYNNNDISLTPKDNLANVPELDHSPQDTEMQLASQFREIL